MIIKLKTIQALRETGALFQFLAYIIFYGSLNIIAFTLKGRINPNTYALKIIICLIIIVSNCFYIIKRILISSNLLDFKNLVSKYLDEVSTAKLNNHDIRLILNELLFFYRYEYILWGIYLLLIFFQIIRHKKAFLFCRSKNTYRNNNKIAHKEI